MTCEERQQYWNGLLDSRDGRSPSFEAEWDGHVDACERCRAASFGYELLHDAIEAWPSPDPASAASLARLQGLGLLHAARVRGRARLARTVRIALPIGLAASAAALAWLAPAGGTPLVPEIKNPERPVVARPVLVALQVAERASRELAREGAGPAARIGRDILDLRAVRDASTALETASSTSEDQDPPTMSTRSTDGRAFPGIRPIPESARHAFSFLLGPEGPPPVEVNNGL